MTLRFGILNKNVPVVIREAGLSYIRATNAKKTIAICDEMFTNFLDPLNISMKNVAYDGNNKDCPYCKKQNSLRPAKDTEIIESGLTVKDYE